MGDGPSTFILAALVLASAVRTRVLANIPTPAVGFHHNIFCAAQFLDRAGDGYSHQRCPAVGCSVPANLGLALTFLEEMWARNLGQLFISPLRPSELIASLMFISLIRTLISVTPAAFLALPLFDVWVFDLGLGLAAFFFNLMVMGWAIGLLVSGLLLRLGLGAESLCWLGIFLIAPITGIYYPVEVLPDWLEPVAWTLPSTYVFEGMRSVLFDQVFRWDLLAGAVCLNLLYCFSAVAYFSGCFEWRGTGQTFATRRIAPFNFLVTIGRAQTPINLC